MMVYDEEDGVTIQLCALVASAGGQGRRRSPDLPVMPEAPAQQPEDPIPASECPPYVVHEMLDASHCGSRSIPTHGPRCIFLQATVHEFEACLL